MAGGKFEGEMSDYFENKESLFEAANFEKNFDDYYDVFSSDFLDGFLANRGFDFKKPGESLGFKDTRFQNTNFTSKSLSSNSKTNGLGDVNDKEAVKGVFKEVLKSYLSQEMASGYYKQYKDYADAVMSGDASKALELAKLYATIGVKANYGEEFTNYFANVFHATNDLTKSLDAIATKFKENDKALLPDADGEVDPAQLSKLISNFGEIEKYNKHLEELERIITTIDTGDNETTTKMKQKVTSWYNNRKSKSGFIGKIEMSKFKAGNEDKVDTEAYKKFQTNLPDEGRRIKDMVTDIFADYDRSVNGKKSALTYLRNFNQIGSGVYDDEDRKSSTPPPRKHYMAMNDSFFNVNSTKYATNVTAMHLLMQYFNAKKSEKGPSLRKTVEKVNEDIKSKRSGRNSVSSGEVDEVSQPDINGAEPLQEFQNKVNSSLAEYKKKNASSNLPEIKVDFLNKVADDLQALGYKNLVSMPKKSTTNTNSVPTEFEKVYTKIRRNVNQSTNQLKPEWGIHVHFTLPEKQMISKLAAQLDLDYNKTVLNIKNKCGDYIANKESIYLFDFYQDVLEGVEIKANKVCVDIILKVRWDKLDRRYKRIQYMVGMPTAFLVFDFTHGNKGDGANNYDYDYNRRDVGGQGQFHLRKVDVNSGICTIVFSTQESYHYNSRPMGEKILDSDFSFFNPTYTKKSPKDKGYMSIVQYADPNGLDNGVRYVPVQIDLKKYSQTIYATGVYGSKLNTTIVFTGQNYSQYLNRGRALVGSTPALLFSPPKQNTNLANFYSRDAVSSYGNSVVRFKTNYKTDEGEKELNKGEIESSSTSESEYIINGVLQEFTSSTTEGFNYICSQNLSDGEKSSISSDMTFSPSNLFQASRSPFEVQDEDAVFDIAARKTVFDFNKSKKSDSCFILNRVPFKTNIKATYLINGFDDFYLNDKLNPYAKDRYSVSPTYIWTVLENYLAINTDSFGFDSSFPEPKHFKINDFHNDLVVTSVKIKNIHYTPVNDMFFRSNIENTTEDLHKSLGVLITSAGGVSGISGSEPGNFDDDLVNIYSTSGVLKNNSVQSAKAGDLTESAGVYYSGNNGKGSDVSPDDFSPASISYDIEVTFQSEARYYRPYEELY